MVSEAGVTVVVKPKAPSRAGYLREWRRNKRLEAAGKRGQPSGAFHEFKEHVRGEAMKKGASSAVMGIYKEMLKLEAGMGRSVKGMSGDELASLFLEAERELRIEESQLS